jgi:hypothetical protein
MGLHLAKNGNFESDFIVILFAASVLGYAFFFTTIMSLLKYSTVKSLEKMPMGHKIMFNFSCSVMVLYGAVITWATKYDTAGVLIFACGLYLISYFWARQHFKLVTQIFAVVLIIFCALSIIYYQQSSAVVLEALSMILLTVFLFFLVFFL